MTRTQEKIVKELDEIATWAEGLSKKATKARKLIEGEGKLSPPNQRAAEIKTLIASQRMKRIKKKSKSC